MGSDIDLKSATIVGSSPEGHIVVVYGSVVGIVLKSQIPSNDLGTRNGLENCDKLLICVFLYIIHTRLLASLSVFFVQKRGKNISGTH